MAPVASLSVFPAGFALSNLLLHRVLERSADEKFSTPSWRVAGGVENRRPTVNLN